MAKAAVSYRLVKKAWFVWLVYRSAQMVILILHALLELIAALVYIVMPPMVSSVPVRGEMAKAAVSYRLVRMV